VSRAGDFRALRTHGVPLRVVSSDFTGLTGSQLEKLHFFAAVQTFKFISFHSKLLIFTIGLVELSFKFIDFGDKFSVVLA
jgi:hypothetical protein